MKQSISINLDSLDFSFLKENNFEHALIYYLNEFVLDKVSNLKEINKEILKEAYFFNESKELHFFEDNNFCGVLSEKEENDEYFIKKSELDKNLKSIETINYVDYDEDLQAYIKATCLYNLSEV